MEQYLNIGQIINTHGIKGQVKVYPLTDDVKRFKELKNVYIEKNNAITEHKVESTIISNGFAILKIDGINDLTSAEAYKNCYLKINRDDAVKLPKGSYFISDIIGLEVKTVEDDTLGVIKDVFQTGSNDVYVVDYKGKELLIPAIKDVVKSIDIQKGTVTVKLLEGMID
jgi:16S rRNA processing protein RimM